MHSSLHELTCQELVELVTAYLENALSENERTRLEQHLATCDGCDRYVEQMRQTIQALGTLQERDITPDAQEKLLNVFREWRGT
jgi:anti-sigma factor RsiW